MAFDRHCGQRDRRCGVTSRRFKDDVFRQLVELAQLLGNDKAVLFITDNNRTFTLHPVQTADGGLQHSQIAFQAKKLFWIQDTGQWPQAAAGASGHHYRIQLCLTHDLSPFPS